MLLVHQFLENTAARTPEKTALVFEGERRTYAEVDHQANRWAQALKDRGVCRGDRFVFILPNCIELVIGIFAALKVGAVFVVVNNSTKLNKLKCLIEDAKPAGLAATSRWAHAIAEINERFALSCVVFVGNDAQAAAEMHDNFISADSINDNYPNMPPQSVAIDLDLACLIYTSGSGGVPKGVMSTHANVAFASGSIIKVLENVPEDTVICAIPISFDYGLYQVLMTFRFGGTLVLERSFAYPAQFLKRLEDERVTGLPGVPTLFTMLLDFDLSNYDLSHIRFLSNTAAALPPAQIRQLQEHFTGAKIYSMYGLTETKRTLYLPPSQVKLTARLSWNRDTGHGSLA